MSVDPRDLRTLSRDALIDEWRRVVSRTVPHHISRRLLIAAIAFEHQLAAAGHAHRVTIRTIRRQATAAPSQTATLCDKTVNQRSAVEALALSKPGTRLLREWNGKTHVVDIVPEGCRWNGETYRSLSAVASAITGTRWSGPRFFRSCTTSDAAKPKVQPS